MDDRASDLGALGGTRTPNLLIRSDLRSQRLPGRSPIDLPECCSPVRGRRQL
jgi:hypothetical protein